MWCIVNLPNGQTQQAIKLDPKAIGQECLEKVCKALGIYAESEYFGLEQWHPNQEESRTHQWINLRNRLSCDVSGGGIQLMLALRVKFWVPVHFLLQESVKNVFYMQAKADLLEGRLNARDWKNAAKLAALLAQADGIRFNEVCLKTTCPIRMKKEYELIVQQHIKHNQQNQQHQQSSLNYKERKEREYVLSFKKRRLSKQKSLESIENSQTQSLAAAVAFVNSSILPSTSNSLNNIEAVANAEGINRTPVFGIIDTTVTEPIASRLSSSPLHVYQSYLIRPEGDDLTLKMPEDFLLQIAQEHSKLTKLRMSQKSAKYWLLREIQDLPGYGEEVFSGFTTHENSCRCDISVGANGITVSIGDEKDAIPFGAIASAKSFRRTFKLEYMNDTNDRKELEIKLPKHSTAAGLYRSITERHAFYVCDTVRGIVTSQFTRDLKGTIASMFKEDTELGKRYVFDIQHTCREVHDHARRILHEQGIEFFNQFSDNNLCEHSHSTSIAPFSSSDENLASQINSYVDRIDIALKQKKELDAVIEKKVENIISEAMTCKICMDRAITTMFNPCCHVMACVECAQRCQNCPSCRVQITNTVKIYLPPELRQS